ncbi:MAG: virulence RhuM family protein [Coriobacteriia bacterium]|nr:virulence RhuM family protein [Coriobacteriia bacterium]
MGEDDVPEAGTGSMLIYRDAATSLHVRLDGATVWLSQRQIAELYQTTPQNVTQHLTHIYDDGELDEAATCKDYLQVRTEGTRRVERSVRHYNLEAILAVGYRVRSGRGTQFRQWATARLSELLVKGFTMDDERIKAGRTLGDDYFDELLERIRDIRSSERMFYQKITDIYATSVDYDSDAEATRLFYQTVQNKMHWAAHGHTAAEIIHERADADQPNMGLMSWKNAPGSAIRKGDVAVAKNYLAADELSALNLIVSAYLDFAELQARNHRQMHMSDWIIKLDDFLRLSDHDVLQSAGSISHAIAEDHATSEYRRYREQQRKREVTEASSDFDRIVAQLEAPE